MTIVYVTPENFNQNAPNIQDISPLSAGTYTNIVINESGQIVSGSQGSFITANETINVTGDVVGSGSTSINAILASVGTPGTFSSVIIDAKGRSFGQNLVVTGDVSGTASGANISLSLPPIVESGTFSAVQINSKGLITGGGSVSLAGDATGTASGSLIPVTLAAVGSPGSYSAVITDGKGRVIGGSPLAVSGDVSGVSTGASLPLTLATIGSAGTYTKIATDSKGRVISGGALLASDVESALGYTPATPVTSSTGTYASVAVNNAGQVTAGSPLTASGDVSGVSTGASLPLTLATIGSAGTYTKISTDTKGRVISGGALLASDVETALGYTPSPPITSSTGTYVAVSVNNAGQVTAGSPLAVSGDASGVSTGASLPLTLAASGVTAGTYAKHVVNSKGLVIQGLPLLAADIDAALGFTPTTPIVSSPGIFTAVSINSAGQVVTGENLSITGDISGTASNNSLNATLATIGSSGTFSKVVTDTKGRIIAGGAIISSDVTNALGYMPVNPNVLAQANGIATLNSSGQLLTSQIPSSLVGAVVYQGTWNASTNTPILTSSVGTQGYYYIVSTAGTTSLNGIAVWNIGDTAIYNGTAWDKIDGQTSEVISVAGMTGVVNLNVSNISGAAPLNSPAFTGSPTTSTPLLTDNSGIIANTSWVKEQNYLTANQIINISGDISGSGGTAITATLATVNSSIGTFSTVVVNGKGLVTNATNLSISGDVSGTASGANITATLVPSGVTSGTYTKYVVNSKGLVTQGLTLTNSDVTTALGYTPTNNSTTILIENSVGLSLGSYSAPMSNYLGSTTSIINALTTLDNQIYITLTSRNIFVASDFGINGGSSDAINWQAALNTLKTKNTATKLDISNLTTTIGTGLVVSYAGQGYIGAAVGISLDGPASITLSGTMTFLTVTADFEVQQGGFAIYRDLVLQGDGTGNQQVFYFVGVSNQKIDNVYLLNNGAALFLNYCANTRVQDMKAYGNVAAGAAFTVQNSLGSYLTGCQAYSYATGFYFVGTLNVGTDGTICLIDSLANGCSTYGFHLVGQYAPQIINATGDVNGIMVCIESSQDGILSNAFFGPVTVAGNPAIQFLKNSSINQANSYWQIDNINTQDRWDLNYLNFARISNCTISQLPVGAGENAIQLYNSQLTSLSNMLLQESVNITNSFYIDGATCSSIAVYDGSFGNPIVIGGTLAQRTIGGIPQTHTITPDYCPAVVSSDPSGLFFPGDVIKYFNGTQMMENQQGFLCPYSSSAMSFTIVYGTPQTFDVSNLFSGLFALTQTQGIDAKLIVIGGYPGSETFINIEYLQTAVGSNITITSSVGNGSGSLSVSVSGSTITMTNLDGTSGENSPTKITLASVKKLN